MLKDTASNRNQPLLDFDTQAEQLLQIIESRLELKQRGPARNFMILKFKSLYEMGVASGRLYEREGVYPYRNFGESADNRE